MVHTTLRRRIIRYRRLQTAAAVLVDEQQEGWDSSNHHHHRQVQAQYFKKCVWPSLKQREKRHHRCTRPTPRGLTTPLADEAKNISLNPHVPPPPLLLLLLTHETLMMTSRGSHRRVWGSNNNNSATNSIKTMNLVLDIHLSA